MGNLEKLRKRYDTQELPTEWDSALAKLRKGFENDLFLELFEPFTVKNAAFPPYNIIKRDEKTFEIEMALAGFTKSDVDVILDGNVLTISSSKGEANGDMDGTEFVHRGIAKRAFSSKFRISDYTEVSECTMENGILRITVSENIPEEKLPKVINIK